MPIHAGVRTCQKSLMVNSPASMPMKYSATPGKTPDKAASFLFQKRDAAFRPGILIPSDDHSIFILPQIQKAAPAFDGFQQVLLHS